MARVLIALIQLICEVNLNILLQRMRKGFLDRDETQLADNLLFELSVVIGLRCCRERNAFASQLQVVKLDGVLVDHFISLVNQKQVGLECPFASQFLD